VALVSFLVASKLTVVEALRSVFDSQGLADPDLGPYPRVISIDYPVALEDWPNIFVQLRVTNMSWTGIDPDEYVLTDDALPVSVDNPYIRLRHGIFDAFLDMQVNALTSGERDRMWDVLVGIFMAGRAKDDTADFFDRIETGEFVGMTVMEGAVEPQGDAVTPVPWNNEDLGYEASLRVGVVGEFYLNAYNQTLVPLTAIQVHETIEDVEAPWSDGGTFHEVGA
jgi:hypothetical protein